MLQRTTGGDPASQIWTEKNGTGRLHQGVQAARHSAMAAVQAAGRDRELDLQLRAPGANQVGHDLPPV